MTPTTKDAATERPNAELVEILAEMGRDGDGTCAVAAKVIAAHDDRLAELEKALKEMVNTFQPFTNKPMGAPHSPVRRGQEHQIEVYKNARAALGKSQP